MAHDIVKLIRDISGRYGVTVPTPAAQEIATALHGDGYQQFTADVMAVWASWTAGQLTEEDAMTAISERHSDLRQYLDS